MHHIHISVYGVEYSNGNMGNNKRKEKEEMTLAEVHVCRLCGKKIDQGRIEIVPERSMIIRHQTKGEQMEFDARMYGKDPDKWVKKRDVINLIIRRGTANKRSLIDDVKEL